MRQCEATTSLGRRCRRQVAPGTRYCHQHGGLDLKRAAAMFLGAVTGNALLPGAGGLIAGAVVGALADHVNLSTTEKKRVFLSFDFDHDQHLKHFMVGQARLERSPFEVIDTSLQEAAPEPEWELYAESAIDQSDLVMIMLGRYTHAASGVRKELAIAQRLGKPTVQIRAQGSAGLPVPGGGRVYVWSWDNLERILE